MEQASSRTDPALLDCLALFIARQYSFPLMLFGSLLRLLFCLSEFHRFQKQLVPGTHPLKAVATLKGVPSVHDQSMMLWELLERAPPIHRLTRGTGLRLCQVWKINVLSAGEWMLAR